jgi:two-component system cell cycle response regulator DivK
MRMLRPRRFVVLIAQDYPDALEMYRDYLRFAGLRVLTASDGYEAVRIATREHPDVIVIDAGLPGLNGWEATAILKKNRETRHLRVMMLTGHVFQESKRRAKASGVDLFVSKPCLPDDLYSHILALAGWPIRARRARIGSREGAAKEPKKKKVR